MIRSSSLNAISEHEAASILQQPAKRTASGPATVAATVDRISLSDLEADLFEPAPKRARMNRKARITRRQIRERQPADEIPPFANVAEHAQDAGRKKTPLFEDEELHLRKYPREIEDMPPHAWRNLIALSDLERSPSVRSLQLSSPELDDRERSITPRRIDEGILQYCALTEARDYAAAQPSSSSGESFERLMDEVASLDHRAQTLKTELIRAGADAEIFG